MAPPVNFNNPFPNAGFNWGKDYGVPTTRDAVRTIGADPVAGGTTSSVTKATVIGAHTRTPDVQKTPHMPLHGAAERAPTADRLAGRLNDIGNIFNSKLKRTARDNEAMAKPTVAHESDEALLNRLMPIDVSLTQKKRQQQIRLRNTELASELRDAANAAGIEFRHAAAALSPVYLASPASRIEGALTALQALRSTNLAGEIEQAGAGAAGDAGGAGEAKWQLANSFMKMDMLNPLMKMTVVSESPIADMADKKKATVSAFLTGADQLINERRAAGETIRFTPAAILNAAHSMAEPRTVAEKGLRATTWVMDRLNEAVPGAGSAWTRPTPEEAHPHLAEFGMLLNGWKADEAGGDVTGGQYLRAEKHLKSMHRQFEITTGNVNGRGDTLGKQILQTINPKPNNKDLSAFNAFNSKGANDATSMGFDKIDIGGISQGRAYKNMALQVHLALKQAGAGTAEAPAALPTNDAGNVSVAMNTLRGRDDAQRVMKNIVRLSISEQYIGQMVPRLSLGRTPDENMLAAIKAKLADTLQLSPAERDELLAADPVQSGLTVDPHPQFHTNVSWIRNTLRDEIQSMTPETLANWAIDVGAPAKITSPLSDSLMKSPPERVGGAPDWNVFQEAFSYLRFDARRTTSDETRNLNWMRPDTQKVIDAISSSVNARLPGDENIDARFRNIGRGEERTLRGRGDIGRLAGQLAPVQLVKGGIYTAAEKKLLNRLEQTPMPAGVSAKIRRALSNQTQLGKTQSVANLAAESVRQAGGSWTNARFDFPALAHQVLHAAGSPVPSDIGEASETLALSKLAAQRWAGDVGQTLRMLGHEQELSEAQGAAMAMVAAFGGSETAILEAARTAGVDDAGIIALRPHVRSALKEIDSEEAREAKNESVGSAPRSLGKNALKIAASTWDAKVDNQRINNAITSGATAALATENPEEHAEGSGGRYTNFAQRVASTAVAHLMQSVTGDSIEMVGTTGSSALVGTTAEETARNAHMTDTVASIVQARMEGVTGREIGRAIQESGASPAQAKVAQAVAALGGTAEDIAAAMREQSRGDGAGLRTQKQCLDAAKSAVRTTKEAGRIDGAQQAFWNGLSKFELGSVMEFWQNRSAEGSLDGVATSALFKFTENVGAIVGARVISSREKGEGQYSQFGVGTMGTHFLSGERQTASTKLGAGANLGALFRWAGVEEFGMSIVISKDYVGEVKATDTSAVVVRQERVGGVGTDDVTSTKMARNAGLVINPNEVPVGKDPFVKPSGDEGRADYFKRLMADDPFVSIAAAEINEMSVTYKKKARLGVTLAGNFMRVGLKGGIDREATASVVSWKETNGRLRQEVSSFSDTRKISRVGLLMDASGALALKKWDMAQSTPVLDSISSILNLASTLVGSHATVNGREGVTNKATLGYKNGELLPTSFLVSDHLTALDFALETIERLDSWAQAKVDKYQNGRKVSPETRAKLVEAEKKLILLDLETTISTAGPSTHFQHYYEVAESPKEGEEKSRYQQLVDVDRDIAAAQKKIDADVAAGRAPNAVDAQGLNSAQALRKWLLQDPDTFNEPTFLIDFHGDLDTVTKGPNIAGFKYGVETGAKTSAISFFV